MKTHPYTGLFILSGGIPCGKKEIFNVGEHVRVINSNPLKGKEIAPPIVKGNTYTVKQIVLDKDGNQHLDIGIVSNYNLITSWETGEKLPDGDKIHWCHPARFEKVKYAYSE